MLHCLSPVPGSVPRLLVSALCQGMNNPALGCGRNPNEASGSKTDLSCSARSREDGRSLTPAAAVTTTPVGAELHGQGVWMRNVHTEPGRIRRFSNKKEQLPFGAFNFKFQDPLI